MSRNTEFTPRTLVPSLEKRVRELEAQNALLDRLCTALNAHIAKLEAVREAASRLSRGRLACDAGAMSVALADLDDALADVENDVTPTP